MGIQFYETKSQTTMKFLLIGALAIAAMVDTDQDTMDTPTATAMVTTMDVILARGLLMPNLRLMLMLLSTMVDTTDTLDTTVMADTDMDVSDTDGRFPQNLFKLFQNCIHPETKKMFFNIKTQKTAYNLYVEKHLT